MSANRVFVPPANETYAYDADGNQTLVTTGTGAWQVEYNGENRPENEDQSTANLNPYRFSSEYADDALGLVYYNYRHYNPKDGRWTSRDKLEEPNKSVNSVCFASNNSIVDSDWIGLLSNPVEVDLNTAIKIFDDWYNNEKRNLEKRDRDGRNWVDYLPECPKELGKAGDKFVSPNSKEWKMSGKDGTSMLKFFHPGGAFELRTADPAKYGGSGNQCVYDECGKLITDLPSSGTVDFVSPTGDIGSVIGHFAADVLPFLYAKLIDNIRGDDSMEYVRRYYEVRPSR